MSLDPLAIDLFSYLQQVLLVLVAVVCLGYGCFLTVATITLFTLLRKGSPFSIGRRFLLAAVTIFMVLSTVYCVTTLLVFYKAVSGGGFIVRAITNGISSPDEAAAIQDAVRIWEAGTVASCLIYVLNDSIVVWRAWAVAGHRVFRLILAASLAFTIISVVVDLHAFYPVVTQKFIGQRSENANGPLNLMVYIPLLFTNIVSTLIIFWKTWAYRKEVQLYLQRNTKQMQVEHVLLLLIESGFIYCGLWILLLVTNLYSGTPFIVVLAVDNLMPFIAAIYPMAIILVVEYQNASARSTRDTPTPKHLETGIRFAPVSSSKDSKDMHSNPNLRWHDISIVQSIANHIESCQELSEDVGAGVDIQPSLGEKAHEGMYVIANRNEIGVQVVLPV